jgi:hypothetical protein
MSRSDPRHGAPPPRARGDTAQPWAPLVAGPKHRVRLCYYAASCEGPAAVLGLHRSGCARGGGGQSRDSASTDCAPPGASGLLLLVPSARLVRSSHARRDAVPAKLVGIVDGLQLPAAQVAASSDDSRAPWLETPQRWPMGRSQNGARNARGDPDDRFDRRRPFADPVQLNAEPPPDFPSGVRRAAVLASGLTARARREGGRGPAGGSRRPSPTPW